MIARKTLWIFLCALLLGSGLALWNATHPDSCTHYLQGEPGVEPFQSVLVGGELVAVPCNQWFLRQTVPIQCAAYGEVVLAIIFAVLAIGDIINARRRRKGMPTLDQ